MNIDNGSLDDTDLSGTKVVLSYSAPGKISDGGLRLGLVIDDAASDEQAAALERIFSGQVGGMFGEFDRADRKVDRYRACLLRLPERAGWGGRAGRAAAATPSAAIGQTEVNFTAFRGQDGNVTTARNAAFGFAPEFTLGKSSGRSGVLGESFEASYGEAAQFEWAS